MPQSLPSKSKSNTNTLHYITPNTNQNKNKGLLSLDKRLTLTDNRQQATGKAYQPIGKMQDKAYQPRGNSQESRVKW